MGILDFQLKKNSSLLSSKINPFLAKLGIPEPTRSLLWVTDEDPSKFVNPFHYQINFVVKDNKIGIEYLTDYRSLYSEPSLIWTKLPFKKHNEKVNFKTYLPFYYELNPEQRWTYLMWLKDITQDIDLSYKFIYFYSLERQLLIGDFDKAVSELIRLYENDKTEKYDFKGAIISSLLLAAGHKNRADIFNLAPIIFEYISNESLILRSMAKIDLKTDDILFLFKEKYIGGNHFTRKFYQKYSEVFKRELKSVYEHYLNQEGGVLSKFDISKLPKNSHVSYYNVSFPKEIKQVKFPALLYSKEFSTIISQLISETYKRAKLKVNLKH